MRIYTVHIKRPGHNKRADPDRGLVLVNEGFCWPAFLLSGLWALWHRMWLWGSLIIVANIALGLMLTKFAGGVLSQGAISFGFAVIIGMIANDLRRRSLSYKGYREFGVVGADGLSAAEGRLLDENPHWVSAFR